MTATKTLSAKQIITGEMLAEMPDVNRVELIKGKVNAMSPTNQKLAILESRFARWLGNYVEERNIGEILIGEAGIYTGKNPDTVRGADVLFISYERLAKDPGKTFLDVAPELVIEIVSPNDRWEDLKAKINEYLAIGVDFVWVVEPQTQTIQVYEAGGNIREYRSGEPLPAKGLLEGFELDIQKLFANLAS